ncbi:MULTISPECIES: translation elongation factor Ts [Oribacterium]|jgi:translation elongation factor Ts|uniref:Elongation factor Ts n=4 Tax=Oribacterium sinus TaxID=237576 RepID=C2KVP1_9FIRM|nr:translation elongation factor Ts [Oribacterium sinus]EEJ52145.1 translation elongation factor Ts [Oribacterium sinus F0268]MBF1305459.1 elongation factor Ts [Oribacterium sinus]
MAEITAALVKELREITGAGMMACKKALTETAGDMDKAVEYLREQGLAGAEKKAGRIAAEGVSFTKISDDGKTGVVVEVNAETDFVAKNEKFQNFVKEVAAQALKTSATDIDSFLQEKWDLDPSKTVSEQLSATISVIGENMNIRRFTKITEENGFVQDYIHSGGRIGVLLQVKSTVVNDAIKDMAKNLAMQIAALNPKYITRAEVDQEYLKNEKEILLAAAKNEKPNAPEKVLLGMVEGRLNKELQEVCLVDQVYVRAEDGKQKVGQYLESVAKAQNAEISLVRFVRYETGEGLEKKNEDFAAEVAAQIK